ncbi:transposase [Paenibacillus sp. P32E]|uniref:transposase n=1 Tax=Paenibacillus sp. P32E TaxID=1349434 RepID=UPI00093A164D|nr:transposase [Paenibacillus sp. P32E]OKP91412.1 transposase [Paenibacillus sp. P32E]
MAGGRPNKYFSNVEPKLLLIEAWARDGLVDDQIANNLGIGIATLYEYKNKYPEFAEALKNGKEAVDIMVENALLKRAMGYTYEEITKENGVETKRVLKEVQPDTTAQIFWLKNRKSKQWRDKQDIEHSGNMGVQIVNDIPRNN